VGEQTGFQGMGAQLQTLVAYDNNTTGFQGVGAQLQVLTAYANNTTGFQGVGLQFEYKGSAGKIKKKLKITNY
jgi:hypothetical protein